MSKVKRSAVEVTAKAKRMAAMEGRKPKVLFVCLGNICRSPAAEGIARKMAEEMGVDVEFDSAGLYAGHAGELPDRRMREAAWQLGYRLDHRSRPVRLSDFDDFDIVIGMDDSNISRLHGFADTQERDDKIVRMTDFTIRHPEYDYVPDPYYEGAEGFRLVLDLLEDGCSELVKLLK